MKSLRSISVERIATLLRWNPHRYRIVSISLINTLGFHSQSVIRYIRVDKLGLVQNIHHNSFTITMGLFSATCTSLARLDGKTAIVTGSNTGIGKCTVNDFFLRGARVIMACRNVEKATEAANDIKDKCKDQKNLGEIVVTELDLSSLKSVRKCADHLLASEKRIDLLINNAGIMMCPDSKTEDGFEMQLGTNHFGHFLLTLLLLPKIAQSTPARIVNVSSMAHARGHMDFSDLNYTTRKYKSLGAYQQSKLANVLFTKELAHRLEENNIPGVNVYSLHPGVIKTELGRHLNKGLAFLFGMFSYFLKTPEQGAQTTIYCAVDEKCANETGLYYAECAVKQPSELARNEEDARKLWDVSLKLVGLDNYDPFKPRL